MNGDHPPVLVYVIGEPGVGKTTAMRAATAGWHRLPLPSRPGRPARDALFDQRSGLIAAIELGAQRGMFSGTDALPMDAVMDAERYVTAVREAPLLLGEGARLGNRRFLTAAVHAGYTVHLAHLHDPARAAAQRAARGTTQHPSWVRGAATRAARLAADPPRGVTVHTIPAANADTVAALLTGVAA